MQTGKRYRLRDSLRWTRKSILLFTLWACAPVVALKGFGIEWLYIPWQPLSLIGIAVAFYLGFKNNTSYERMWEARKIWGGIVNASRSFTVLTKNYINNDETEQAHSDVELQAIMRRVVHRHIAWLYALTFELRKVRPWEHQGTAHLEVRKMVGTVYSEELFQQLRPYLSEADFEYIMSKGNRSSHLLSVQTSDLMQLRSTGIIEHFRHLEMQALITEFYTLQGKSERIKNFPFPRQYASANYYFVVLFIFMLPFGMIDVFTGLDQEFFVWLSIPFTVIVSWVYWFMEMVGEYSENPFEGLHNDVPISSMARGIEIDIREMLDEDDVPGPLEELGMGLVV